jgi:enterochelin esterase-like enzyme
MSLLLINDGQDMEKAGLQKTLEQLYAERDLEPLLCAAIHAGHDRKMEYAVASQTDYKGRGAKAVLYTSFIMEELIPYIKETYRVSTFREKAFAGFSLGGLSALDIVWNH